MRLEHHERWCDRVDFVEVLADLAEFFYWVRKERLIMTEIIPSLFCDELKRMAFGEKRFDSRKLAPQFLKLRCHLFSRGSTFPS